MVLVRTIRCYLTIQFPVLLAANDALNVLMNKCTNIATPNKQQVEAIGYGRNIHTDFVEGRNNPDEEIDPSHIISESSSDEDRP